MAIQTPRALAPNQAAAAYPQLLDPATEPLIEMADAATIHVGDVTSDASSLVDLAAEAGDEGTVIVVDGNLTLTAPQVEWGTDDHSNDVLLVTGDLVANGLLLSGVGSVKVLGSVRAKAVAGCYGDDGGSLDIGGDLEAELVVARTYFCIAVAGEVRAQTVVSDSTYAHDGFTDYIDAGQTNRFVPEVLDRDRVDTWKLVAFAVAGKPYFVNEGKPRDGVYEEQM